MVSWGTCQNCGSAAMPCKCMLAKPAAKAPLRELPPMQPMLNKHVAEGMRVAGWHNDLEEHTRLFMAAKYNSEQAKALWDEGRAARAAGMDCNCRACRRERVAANG